MLFAAERDPRVFTPDEVALLCSLAARAAIAIDTARAISDTWAPRWPTWPRRTRSSRSTRRPWNGRRRPTTGSPTWCCAVATCRRWPPPQMARLLAGRITLHDPHGRPVTTARPDADHAPAAPGSDSGDGLGPGRRATGEPGTAALAQAVEDSRTAGRVAWPGAATGSALCSPGRSCWAASCCTTGRVRLEDPDRRLFERAGLVTALLLLLRRTVAETENRIRGELIADLLTAPDRDPAGLAERWPPARHRAGPAAACCWSPRPDRPTWERLARAATQYLFGSDRISAEHAGAVVLLLPPDRAASG